MLHGHERIEDRRLLLGGQGQRPADVSRIPHLRDALDRDGAGIELGHGRLHDAREAVISPLDPVTGKLERVSLPAFGTEEAVTFWRPVVTEVLAKIKARLAQG